MADAIRYIKAREILQAIQHAKKENPQDKFGENALQIDVANKKKLGTVTYVPVNIKIFNGKNASGDDKWDWFPLNIMFRKTNTRSKIKPYEERIQQDNKSVKVQFRVSSKSYWLNRETGKEEEEDFGEAMDQLDTIIQRKIARHLTSKDPKKKLVSQNSTINTFVQRGQKNEDGQITKTFDDPIIYVEVKFRPKEKGDSILPSALPWQCTIHDADKKRAGKPPAGEPPFEYASIERGEGEPVPINYSNIHSFITGGSSLTGFINASQISLSMFGVSLSPRFTAIIVKKSMGFKPNFDVMEGQFDDLGDAAVDVIDDEPSANAADAADAAKSNGTSGAYDEFGEDFGEGGSNDDLDAGVGEDELPPDNDFDELDDDL